MFKGFTKDLAGTADICTIVSSDFSKLYASAYLLSSDPNASSQDTESEEILFAFTSAKEEFAFTNQALITVRGENATTTRKVVERIEFRDSPVTKVQFETTGRVDRDCEIKFHIESGGSDHEISVDIAKKQEDEAKVYYKALVALAREQEERSRRWSFAQNGLKSASETLRMHTLAIATDQTQHTKKSGAATAGLVDQANQVLDWLTSDFERLNPRCFKEVIMRALAGRVNQ